jgi:hypothetical protein
MSSTVTFISPTPPNGAYRYHIPLMAYHIESDITLPATVNCTLTVSGYNTYISQQVNNTTWPREWQVFATTPLVQAWEAAWATIPVNTTVTYHLTVDVIGPVGQPKDLAVDSEYRTFTKVSATFSNPVPPTGSAINPTEVSIQTDTIEEAIDLANTIVRYNFDRLITPTDADADMSSDPTRIGVLQTNTEKWVDPFSETTYGDTHYWNITEALKGGDAAYTQTYYFTPGLAKATCIQPTDGSGPGIDFSDFLMVWANSQDPDTYDVYIGPAADNLTCVATGYAATSRMTSLVELEGLFGRSPIEGVVYWRIDSHFGETTVTGDVWSFDPRPGKATDPDPEDEATGVSLYADLAWTAGAAASTSGAYAGDESPVSLGDPTSEVSWGGNVWLGDTEYTWRIDSINQFGTTTGDEWTFTTFAFAPPAWLFPSNGYVVGAAKYAIWYSKIGD